LRSDSLCGCGGSAYSERCAQERQPSPHATFQRIDRCELITAVRYSEQSIYLPSPYIYNECPLRRTHYCVDSAQEI